MRFSFVMSKGTTKRENVLYILSRKVTTTFPPDSYWDKGRKRGKIPQRDSALVSVWPGSVSAIAKTYTFFSDGIYPSTYYMVVAEVEGSNPSFTDHENWSDNVAHPDSYREIEHLLVVGSNPTSSFHDD